MEYVPVYLFFTLMAVIIAVVETRQNAKSNIDEESKRGDDSGKEG